jgi:hypothetical protein
MIMETLETITITIPTKWNISNEEKDRKKKQWTKVSATLIDFPQESIIKGVARQNEFRPPKIPEREDTIEKYNGIKLANYESLWWIYYGENHLTGSFDSKEKAIKWFEKAGR